LTNNKDVDARIEEGKLKTAICTAFVFCYVWAIGGNLRSTSWDSFDTFVRGQFEENPDAKVKLQSSTFLKLNLNNLKFFVYGYSWQVAVICSAIM
jgi:hypothetical protein